MDPLVILFGLGVGILIGLTGIGGGSLPGGWIGTELVTKVHQDGLRPALGVILLAAALAVFTKAGVAMPVAVIVGLPLTIGLLAWALHHWRLRRRPTLEVV